MPHWPVNEPLSRDIKLFLEDLFEFYYTRLVDIGATFFPEEETKTSSSAVCESNLYQFCSTYGGQ